ncbi:hypothetical protein M409DRAFT_49430 [Zasmidium cellare ATCC 36951]|uniref:Myb-like domain-containing protein n=1 Tax=Zasmidium cellare ATCC 36951 TaxID=1080233 RepID=A0A6A6D3E7_ZASCE|nr:uncharacterized protein M409DRAFT_49430 [Zasmidium cellare ATCC 36951]KAF2172920.1 hypothetical protein M409DRAFT_49430 [Zasmidium cellare ATCC 36951]
MPKESKIAMSSHSASISAPYPSASSSGQRNAAIWSSADDEILLRARASGLNWQPIASRHFPNKTANACRKRHERLMERRLVDDWDSHKLELLAQEYMACRREMWEILAARLGERWAVVEAKCMEKGLKTLQTAARTAHRKAAADSQSFEDRGISDHNSDSGIGLGSDTEMEVGDEAGPSTKASSWHAHPTVQQPHHDHVRSRSLPQPLPLYQPPPPVIQRRTFEGSAMTTSPQDVSFQGSSASQRCSPESQNGRGGISIQSIVSN